MVTDAASKSWGAVCVEGTQGRGRQRAGLEAGVGPEERTYRRGAKRGGERAGKVCRGLGRWF